MEENPPTRGRRRSEGLALTCRAVLLSHGSPRFEVDNRRTWVRGGGPELPTSGSASLSQVKHCGIWFTCDLCRPAHSRSCRGWSDLQAVATRCTNHLPRRQRVHRVPGETRPWLEWQSRPCTLRTSTAVFLRDTLLYFVVSGVFDAQKR